MAESLSESRAEERLCFDPECGGTAEPDQDGEYRYYVCNECGNEFGWERVPSELTAISSDGSCAVGVPEDLRRAASAGFERAMAEESRTEVPLLQIGRRPRD